MFLKRCNICLLEKERFTEFPTNGRLTSGAIRYKCHCKACVKLTKKYGRDKEAGKIARKLAREKRIAETGHHVRDWENVRKRMSLATREVWERRRRGELPPLKTGIAEPFRDWLTEYKKGLICMDCQISFKDFPFLVDFHHRDPARKSFAISELPKKLGARRKAVVLEEIAKCDALCSNCHRKRHFLEKGTYVLNTLAAH